MPFDYASKLAPLGPSQAPGKFAVIGSGVSGLAAAWLLSKHHHVRLFEADERLGGHANTVNAPIGPGGEMRPVDAGFIVFNKPNYPNLTAWFEHLSVAVQESCMSFGASLRGGALEYSGQSLSSVFACRSKMASPSYLRMIFDIARFHRKARRALKEGVDDQLTLKAFVARGGFGQAFARDFLAPMASAIWSTPSREILDYPSGSFFRFFANHGLLQVLDMPIWHTVAGGSQRYVSKVAAALATPARLSCPVARLERNERGVTVISEKGEREVFDRVIVATHADAALSMLDRPTAEEKAVLSAFAYQRNKAVMHFDARQMPRRRQVWSSWNYMDHAAENGVDPDKDGAGVTYWMNRLQNLSGLRDIFVTLNPQSEIADEDIVAAFDYEHPLFNVAACKAQKALWSLQGRGGVWYCGAHFGQGFHEDGLQAGLAAAEDAGGVRRPWSVENESGRIFIDAGQRAPA